MAQVDLFDILKLENSDIDFTGKSPISVEITSSGGIFQKLIESIPVEENLITKATRFFCQEIGISGSFVFSLEKNIPSGAGLAGGSSDAAAAIRLLNTAVKLPEEKLLNVARATGSDVPFHLAGGCSICEGTGDILEAIDISLNYHVVLVMKTIHVNTGAAYKLLERTEDFHKQGENIDLLKTKLRHFAQTGSLKDINIFVNDFESVIFKQYPELADIKAKLYKQGAVFAAMSGSGSTIIGLFDDEKKVHETVKCLNSDAEDIRIAHFISSRVGFL